MAVDLYTGPLTRYYLGLWENQAQAFCRENGKEYHVISPMGLDQLEEEPASSPQETAEAIKIWMHTLSQSFGCQISWEEGESIPYYSTQFSECSEVQALSCYNFILETSVLDDFPKTLDISKDPVVKQAEKDGIFLFFNTVEFYFPTSLPGSGIFQIELPNEREVICSSTQKLLEELEGVAQKIWKVPINYLDSLPEEEIYCNYALRKDPLALAIFGLRKLYQHALFSHKNNLPILLDY